MQRLNPLSGFVALIFAVSTACHADRQETAEQGSLTIALLGQSLIEHDPRRYLDAPLSTVVPTLMDADIVFSNLEVSICSEGVRCEPTRHDQYFHGAGPEVLDYLHSIGVNLLSLSNNHSWDYGTEGILYGLEEVSRRGMVHAGTGETLRQALSPAYLKTDAYTVALIAAASAKLKPGAAATAERPGVNVLLPGDETARQQNIASIGEAVANADVVIVYQHFQSIGTMEWQKSWARAAIDAGADVFVSHGEPVLGGVEQYKEGLIFYGLGNFIFHTRSEIGHYPVDVWRSVIARVSMRGHRAVEVEFIPVIIDEGRPGENFLQTRGYPEVASGREAEEILGSLIEKSREFGTDLDLRNGRAYWVLKE
jgi:poly-gamma-glutamate synthesis protein (capsule biosynthesis protein)